MWLPRFYQAFQSTIPQSFGGYPFRLKVVSSSISLGLKLQHIRGSEMIVMHNKKLLSLNLFNFGVITEASCTFNDIGMPYFIYLFGMKLHSNLQYIVSFLLTLMGTHQSLSHRLHKTDSDRFLYN